MDRTKRIYFSEESEALQTAQKAEKADDIAKGRQKDFMAFFQSKNTLMKKAGSLSVKQDEIQIKSTGARNDYILALATANAHQHQYFKNDLPVSCNICNFYAVLPTQLFVQELFFVLV